MNPEEILDMMRRQASFTAIPAEKRPSPNLVMGEAYLQQLVQTECNRILEAAIPKMIREVHTAVINNLTEPFGIMNNRISGLEMSDAELRGLVTQVQRQVFGGKQMPRFNLKMEILD